MTYSMTGFGRAQFTLNQNNFNIEIRTLNSKQLDLNVRLPHFLREKEMEIRAFKEVMMNLFCFIYSIKFSII